MIANILTTLLALVLQLSPSVIWKAAVEHTEGDRYQLVVSGDIARDYYVHPMSDPNVGTLLEVFKQAKEEGLRCDFTIVDVPEDQQLYSDCINYNSKLSYDEVIKRIRRSRCLVDVIQGGSTGLTIKTVEAVMYGRKLLTTNQNVVNEAFYNSQNILVYDGNTSISSFLNIPLMQYTDDDKYVFSPDYLFSKIDEYCK